MLQEKYLLNIDSSKLNNAQKQFLKIMLTGDNYFIPYTIDGNWNFADCMKIINKIELVTALLDGSWHYETSECVLEDNLYMVSIYINDVKTKDKILASYKKFEDHYLKEDIESYIELYIPQSYWEKITDIQ